MAKTRRYVTQDCRIFDVPAPYYLASCDKCGWVGSSGECEEAPTGVGDADVLCPKCHARGADYGEVAENATEH
jgi:predicted nucleic-acid-binding Zn-ribbon protein